MSNSRHRVVVQLSDVEREDDRKNPLQMRISPSSAISISSLSSHHVFRRPFNNDVEMLNDHTLLVGRNLPPNNGAPRELHFDCVGSASDARVRGELTALMDTLILNHQNCCLLRFTVVRECQMNFLCNLLVTDVDQRLQTMHAIVHTIKLEYYDVSKYDVVNVLNKYTLHKNKRRNRMRNQFSNTLELLKWLQADYSTLWSAGQGHECFDFQFVYTDGRRHVQKVKFSLMMLYLGKMDSDTKTGLRSFLENVNGRKKVKHSMITACLLEYFSGEENWRTWMVFNLPLIYGGLFTDELLHMATAAYNGVKTISRKDEGDVAFEKTVAVNIKKSEIKLDEKRMPMEKRPLMLTPLSIENSLKERKKSFTKLFAKRGDHYSTKDFNSLSAWYCKIDDKFSKVVHAMQAFHHQKSENRISRICNEVRLMMRQMECNDNKLIGDAKALDCDRIDVQAMWEQYKMTLSSFRNLMKEVEQSNYVDLLKVYLKTKSYELSQNALSIKMKLLERCQARVTAAIKEEVCLLNSLRKSNLHTKQVTVQH